MLLQAYRRGCEEDCLAIISILSSANQVFIRQKDGSPNKYLSSNKNKNDLSLLAELVAKFMQTPFKDKKKYCKENQLNMKSLIQAENGFKEISKEMVLIKKKAGKSSFF